MIGGYNVGSFYKFGEDTTVGVELEIGNSQKPSSASIGI